MHEKDHFLGLGEGSRPARCSRTRWGETSTKLAQSGNVALCDNWRGEESVILGQKTIHVTRSVPRAVAYFGIDGDVVAAFTLGAFIQTHAHGTSEGACRLHGETNGHTPRCSTLTKRSCGRVPTGALLVAPLSHESTVVTLSTSSFWLIPSRCAPTRSWSMLRPPWSSWCSCPPKRRPDEDAGTAMQVSSTRDQSAELTLGVPATIAAAASLRGDTVCTEWPPHGVRRRLDT